MRAALAAYRMQMSLVFRTPNFWMVQFITPAQTILFLSVIDAFGRPDLLAHAIIAPTLITIWYTAVWTGGSVVRNDRWNGALELHAAAPAPYGVIVPARVAAVMSMALLAVPLALGTAAITYGVDIDIQHPWLLLGALVLVVVGTTGFAAILTSMTILSRAANTIQNSASYPFLLLGGVFVPLALLPTWVQPLGHLVFLSWGSDLVRDGITEPTVDWVPGRLAVLTALALAGFVVAHGLIRVVMRRVRVTGEIAVQ
ncbi:MAG TPA: ABC transporter permease [Acidimicrobiia bacterium]|nr:ABC transporter permease [Acidimicrobiia bacterium]